MIFAGQSDIGRRANNEDSFNEANGCFALADGVGGGPAGEDASRIAVGAACEHLAQVCPQSEADVIVALHQAVQAAQIAVLKNATGWKRGMATTLVIAFIYGSKLFIACVGDSRGYLQRGHRLVPMTRDQNHLNAALDEGKYGSTEAELLRTLRIPEGHPAPDFFYGLAQTVGDEAKSPRAVITVADLRQHDRFVLCTDGLTDECSDERIGELIRLAPDPKVACRSLIDAANQAGADGAGENDNITTIVVFLDDEDLPPPTPDDIANLAYQVYVPPSSDSAV